MFEDDIYRDVFNDESNVLNQSINGENDENLDENPPPTAEKIEIKIRKKRNILRPIDRFMGERGLQSIAQYYKGVKYQGKHHEKEDINKIMQGLQHWAHRAFPTMKFDDSLTVLEGLTKKRIVQTHMTKYRLDMLQPPSGPVEGEREEEQLAGESEPMDEFDDLLGNQIEEMTRVQKQKAHSTALNNTSLMNQSDVSLGCSAIPSTPEPTAAKTRLTAEQMAMIADNRLKALERLKQKQADAAAAEQLREKPQEEVGGGSDGDGEGDTTIINEED